MGKANIRIDVFISCKNLDEHGVLFGQTESENMQKRPKDLYGVPEPKPNNPDQACMMS